MTQFIRFLIICGLVFGLLILYGCDSSGGSTDEVNQAPTATITSPSEGSKYTSSANIPFTGIGTDAEDGEVLGSTFEWTSDRDDLLYSGRKWFSTNHLSVGTHTITLAVTDKDGDTGTDSITITIEYNNPPTAAIISPLDGSTFIYGTKIFFSGTGSDKEDGELSGDFNFEWMPNGTPWISYDGKNFSTYDFCPGTEIITLTVKDMDGATGTDSVTITIIRAYPRVNFNQLPDTGQNDSYTKTFGEDSDYTINSQSYTKLDENGNPIAESAASWPMVRDNVTGLVWEVKTDDGSIHDRDNRYTWDSVQDTFIPSLNSSRFGGYSDWRMPSVMELSTIIDHGSHSPAINTNYFPNTKSSYYLSSVRKHCWSYPLCVDFINGRVYDPNFFFWGESEGKMPNYGYMRAVRGGSGPASGQEFVDNGDGTVTDTETGLMWKKTTASNRTWEEALTYCETLTLAGYSDWRLPNRIELQSLVDYNRITPSIDTDYFPDTKPQSRYWSSTSDIYSGGAWYVDLYHCFVVSEKAESYDVRAVRGGQISLMPVFEL